MPSSSSAGRVMRKLSTAGLLGAAVTLLHGASLGAQANLSGQGLGFPTGQISTRAEGAVGATAELDPLSMVNPAALGFIGATTLFFQIEPEYRRGTHRPPTGNTTTAR